jgi:hypothetical protein
MKDDVTYNKGCPGPGVTAAEWLIEKKVCPVGGNPQSLRLKGATGSPGDPTAVV